MYKDKYLKYKSKYLELQQNMWGGGDPIEPLRIAIRLRHVSDVIKLMETLTDEQLNTTNPPLEGTPLQIAINPYGDKDLLNPDRTIIALLLIPRSSQETRDMALLDAVQQKNYTVVTALIISGADVNATSQVGSTPLDRANHLEKWASTPEGRSSNAKIKAILLANGAKTQYEIKQYERARQDEAIREQYAVDPEDKLVPRKVSWEKRKILDV